MSKLDYVKSLPSVSAGEHLLGLESMVKIHNPAGDFAFLSVSDLDLDTDGKHNPKIKYESTNQGATSLDSQGKWLDSNEINFIVLPGGFTTRHSNVGLKTLATVFYGDKMAHAVVADFGPKIKFGEGSIELHRELGFERVRLNGHIRDVGIDSGVSILLYIGSSISKIPFTQADINAEAEVWWKKFSAPAQ